MDLPVVPMSFDCLPRIFIDKRGQQHRLEQLTEDMHGSLVEMYLAFQPRNSFQGLPPLRDEVCVKWVHDILGTAVHIVSFGPVGTQLDSTTQEGPHTAVYRPRVGRPDCIACPRANNGQETAMSKRNGQNAAATGISGHVALFPVNEERCELLVVVNPEFQNLGLGTELTRTCVGAATELGFRRIWLPVDATNVRARRVYEKCGFEYVSRHPSRELDMAHDLNPLPLDGNDALRRHKDVGTGSLIDAGLSTGLQCGTALVSVAS